MPKATPEVERVDLYSRKPQYHLRKLLFDSLELRLLGKSPQLSQLEGIGHAQPKPTHTLEHNPGDTAVRQRLLNPEPVLTRAPS